MFIGHYGVALAAKKIEPKLSLGWLFAASQVVDILWTMFVLAGIEKVEIHPGHTAASPLNFVSYPYTHSLLMAVVWSVVVYVIARFTWNARAGLILGAVALSHWFLDVPVHIPDLPLAFGDSPMVGLGLWNSKIGTVALECACLLGGLWIYMKSTKSSNNLGKWGIPVFCLILLGTFAMTTFSGEAPPNTTTLAGMGLTMYVVFSLVAMWLDRKRVVA